MGNSLRCCLACVLPCGALDLIRIVHLNGFVEEITGPITAGEVLKANPNHVLTKPTSQGVVRRILILSPETDLKRGSIYFLIPASSLPEKKTNNTTTTTKASSKNISMISSSQCDSDSDTTSYLKLTTHIVPPEKKSSSSRRDRRHRRSGVWQPHLQSISED